MKLRPEEWQLYVRVRDDVTRRDFRSGDYRSFIALVENGSKNPNFEISHQDYLLLESQRAQSSYRDQKTQPDHALQKITSGQGHTSSTSKEVRHFELLRILPLWIPNNQLTLIENALKALLEIENARESKEGIDEVNYQLRRLDRGFRSMRKFKNLRLDQGVRTTPFARALWLIENELPADHPTAISVLALRDAWSRVYEKTASWKISKPTLLRLRERLWAHLPANLALEADEYAIVKDALDALATQHPEKKDDLRSAYRILAYTQHAGRRDFDSYLNFEAVLEIVDKHLPHDHPAFMSFAGLSAVWGRDLIPLEQVPPQHRRTVKVVAAGAPGTPDPTPPVEPADNNPTSYLRSRGSFGDILLPRNISIQDLEILTRWVIRSTSLQIQNAIELAKRRHEQVVFLSPQLREELNEFFLVSLGVVRDPYLGPSLTADDQQKMTKIAHRLIRKSRSEQSQVWGNLPQEGRLRLTAQQADVLAGALTEMRSGGIISHFLIERGEILQFEALLRPNVDGEVIMTAAHLQDLMRFVFFAFEGIAPHNSRYEIRKTSLYLRFAALSAAWGIELLEESDLRKVQYDLRVLNNKTKRLHTSTVTKGDWVLPERFSAREITDLLVVVTGLRTRFEQGETIGNIGQAQLDQWVDLLTRMQVWLDESIEIKGFKREGLNAREIQGEFDKQIEAILDFLRAHANTKSFRERSPEDRQKRNIEALIQTWQKTAAVVDSPASAEEDDAEIDDYLDRDLDALHEAQKSQPRPAHPRPEPKLKSILLGDWDLPGIFEDRDLERILVALRQIQNSLPKIRDFDNLIRIEDVDDLVDNFSLDRIDEALFILQVYAETPSRHKDGRALGAWAVYRDRWSKRTEEIQSETPEAVLKVRLSPEEFHSMARATQGFLEWATRTLIVSPNRRERFQSAPINLYELERFWRDLMVYENSDGDARLQESREFYAQCYYLLGEYLQLARNRKIRETPARQKELEALQKKLKPYAVHTEFAKQHRIHELLPTRAVDKEFPRPSVTPEGKPDFSAADGVVDGMIERLNRDHVPSLVAAVGRRIRQAFDEFSNIRVEVYANATDRDELEFLRRHRLAVARRYPIPHQGTTYTVFLAYERPRISRPPANQLPSNQPSSAIPRDDGSLGADYDTPDLYPSDKVKGNSSRSSTQVFRVTQEQLIEAGIKASEDKIAAERLLDLYTEYFVERDPSLIFSKLREGFRSRMLSDPGDFIKSFNNTVGVAAFNAAKVERMNRHVHPQAFHAKMGDSEKGRGE